jgi:multisubunit Na+/H+ antiporter MnhB subunit
MELPMTSSATNHRAFHPLTHGLVVCVILAMAGAVIWALWTAISPTGASLREPVYAELANSGVKNPVTAVLLNFRSYDTLLEIAVLILAVLGTWSLPPLPPLRLLREAVSGAILRELVRILTPIMIIASGYLLWVGADAPGGAFQGGAVLAGAWVLLLLSGQITSTTIPEKTLRVLIVFGFSIFLIVAIGMMLSEGHLLHYPRAWAKSLLLVIEAALLFSIATILVSLFTGRPILKNHASSYTTDASFTEVPS